jgi:hypothetical protein
LLLLHPKAGAVVGLLWALRLIATTRTRKRGARAAGVPLPWVTDTVAMREAEYREASVLLVA